MIRKILLQNFMSYESASVPLSEGLNMVCGPNGAGKSSILLAISLVLGQSYTERAKRLSDLIRWGRNEARITLTLDNKLKDGKKLFPRVRGDSVEVTRVIRKSGEYNYFIQGRIVSKSEVVSAFNKVGLNPNNMLVIMHQFMVGRFSLTSPQEKLAMLEEAVGFQSYRRDVLEALNRLKRFEVEEEKLASALDSAKATYEFWKRERDKFLKKRELTLRLDELNREIAWLKVGRKERALTKLLEKIKELEGQKSRAESDAESSLRLLALEESRYEALLKEKELKESRLMKALEEKAWLEARLALTNALLKGDALTPPQANFLIRILIGDESPILGGPPPALNELKRKLEGGLRNSVEEVIEAKSNLNELNRALKEGASKLIELKVKSKVEEYKAGLLKREINNLKGSLGIEEEELKALRAEAEKLGPKIPARRKLSEILMEKRLIEEQLKPLAGVSGDIEKIYASYANLFEKLKNRAEEVSNNRRKLYEELKGRQKTWADLLKNFLKELTADYNSILSPVEGRGEIRLINERDVEKAGLEISVGFRGSEPKPLDSLTQSGGERSIALMAFLLALQRRVAAPFRAVDEFDVHMDPKNRETIARLITSNWRGRREQYLVITSGEVSVPEEGTHVIIVQNVGGSSRVAELKPGIVEVKAVG